MAITISGSGITSANIADGTIVNADIADVAASKLTGALPAISGASLTGVGKVLQVVHGSTTTNVLNNSLTFIDTGLTATITPVSTSSKILIIQNVHSFSTSINTYARYQLQRGSVVIREFGFPVFAGNSTAMAYAGGTTLDSPSTTSAVIYKVQFNAKGGNIYAQYNDSNGDAVSTITLMEIGV
jgi:hypothetical protein